MTMLEPRATGRPLHDWTDSMEAMDPADAGIALAALVTPLRQRAALLVRVTAVGAIAGVLVALVWPRQYTAETSFTMESTSGGINLPAGLAGVASSFGLSLPTGRQSMSPDFITTLAASREVLDRLLAIPVPVGTAAGPGADGRTEALIDALRISEDDSLLRREKAWKKLRKQIVADVDRKSGIVSLRFSDRYRWRAALLANRLRDVLNDFNVERLQASARRQRQFAEGQLAQAQADLRQAEGQLVQFLLSNRSYSLSPILTAEYQRLQRAVQLRQEVAVTLAKSSEEARISEGRSSPVLVVVDDATPPARHSSPIGSLVVIGASGGALLLGVLYVLWAARRRLMSGVVSAA